jgi:hypothetical protein
MVVLAIPTTFVPRELSLLVYAIFKVILAAAVAFWLTRGSRPAVLITLTALALINDIAPGNFMVPITAAMAVATFGQPTRRSGVAFGFVAAAVPKPFLAPYFVWLLVHRRKPAEGAIATGVVMTLVAAAIAGPGSYVDWVRNLMHGTVKISGWEGNYGVSAYLPDLAVPIAVAVMLISLLVVARADRNRSLAWVLPAGILASPYAGPLETLPLLLILPLMRPLPRLFSLATLQFFASYSAALTGLLGLAAGPLGIIPASESSAAGADGRPYLAGPPAAPVAPAASPTGPAP